MQLGQHHLKNIPPSKYGLGNQQLLPKDTECVVKKIIYSNIERFGLQ